MKNTTLCYIEKDGRWLMLRRDRKENDENAGKWIGVGGKFEEGESPEDCVRREVREETGLVLTRQRLRGVVTFVSDECGTEYMFVFTADEWTGELCEECAEGTLAWVEKSRVPQLDLWEGDRIFLPYLLDGEGPFFSLKLCYRKDALCSASLDGVPL